MSSPDITVVMITRDRRAEAVRTLAHLTSLPDAAPIVVADNGSADGTAEAIAAQFPAVELLRCADNLGAVARNLAVEHVTTRHVAFCDDDMRWQPGALTRAAADLDAHPELGGVMGRCLVEPDLREDPLTPELRHSPLPSPPDLPGPVVLGGLAGAAAFRTSAFREVGGFSRLLWFAGEEELLAIDLAARGWRLCWDEDVVVHHAASAVRQSRQRRELGLRNALWTTWLRRPVPSAVRRSAAILGSAPKDTTTARALARALAGIGGVLRERAVVPDQVEAGLRTLERPQRRSPARQYQD